MRAGVAVSEIGTWHVDPASLRHLARTVVMAVSDPSHCIHRLLSQSLQHQPCRRIDAAGAKRYILGSAAAQPCLLVTLAGFSGAQPVLCAVRGRSRSAWRARTGEHGRSGAALHAKVTVS